MRRSAVLIAALAARVKEVVVDLAGAQDPRLGSGGRLSSPRMAWKRPRKIGERRGGRRMAQQALGRHDDQRLAPRSQHLPPQEVEELGRRRRIDHLHIVFGAELQEALEAGARVLGPLPFVAVRQGSITSPTDGATCPRRC